MRRSCSSTSYESRARNMATVDRTATVTSSPGHRCPSTGPPPCGTSASWGVGGPRNRRIEPVGVGPQVRVVVESVQVEQDHGLRADRAPRPLQLLCGQPPDEGSERIEPPHLLGEGEGVRRAVLTRQSSPVAGVTVEGVGGEHREPGDGDGRTQHVEDLDGGGAGREQRSVEVAVGRDRAEQGVPMRRRPPRHDCVPPPPGEPAVPPDACAPCEL